MYNQNDFLDKSLEIINNNRIKSNSLKNHFLKNILNDEYVSQFLGYLSELEYDLETLNNYISDFQLLNDNMIQNLHESNIKMNEYQNEICRLKQALDRANDEIHRLRNQNVYNYAYTRNKEFDIKNKFVMNNSEEEKNVDNTNKFNYFRNYLNSTQYNTFRKEPNDISGRLTYYRDFNNNNKMKINYNNTQKEKTNSKTIIKKDNNSNEKNNKLKNNTINNRKSQSLNKTKKNSNKNENNNNHNRLFKTVNKDINDINKNISINYENTKNRSVSSSKEFNINNNDKSPKISKNEDIKDYIKQKPLENLSINSNSNSLSNTPITNYNTDKNIYGKIIKFNRDISTPINNINQIYPNQNLYTPIRENYSSSKSNNYPEQDSSLVFSKRMQNYIHSQNLKRRFAEISKDSIDMRQNRLNNIIEKISKDKNKLNELKLMFGNNIEAQIYNGDLSDIYLNKIENILYYMDSNKSIISLSKRFQIQNNTSSNNKNELNNNYINDRRFVRKKLNNKNYNRISIKRWNTAKNFIDNKKRNNKF